MIKNLNILLTTVGGLTSPDIIKALRSIKDYNIKIYGIDPFEYAVGKYFLDGFAKCVYSKEDEESFILLVKDLIYKWNIDVVIPCGNEDVLALSKHNKNLENKVLADDYNILVNLFDKIYVYKKLKERLPEYAPNFRVVSNLNTLIQALEELDFEKRDLILKPRYGRGGRGVYKIVKENRVSYDDLFNQKPKGFITYKTLIDILKNYQTFPELIISETLIEPFFSSYNISQNGRNLLTLVHKKEWGDASQTWRGYFFYSEKFENISSKIIENFQISYLSNMEFGTSTDNRIVLFDLNPRIGASTALFTEIGVNFLLLSLKLFFKESIDFTNKKILSGRFIRYYDKVFEYEKD